ncbi:MAG TPA: hypothetical protein VNI01_12650 [Elusimicrobiota bacterium]|jgi:hypothetical protein|nr:hypothetical protein [Elusimicrobiota bacterium]
MALKASEKTLPAGPGPKRERKRLPRGGARPFSARLDARGGPPAQPGCARCAVGRFSSPEEANAFATIEGASVGCYPCRRLRYWAFDFEAGPRSGPQPAGARVETLLAGGVLFVRVRCLACGAVDSVLFRGDGAHVPFNTCCKAGRLMWRTGAYVEWIGD